MHKIIYELFTIVSVISSFNLSIVFLLSQSISSWNFSKRFCSYLIILLFFPQKYLIETWGCVHFVSLCKTRYHGNFWKIPFVGTVHTLKKKVSVVPTQNLYVYFIRTCHHPIREGIDQKLKYRQNPYKNVITLTFSNQFWTKKLHPDPLDEICRFR